MLSKNKRKSGGSAGSSPPAKRAKTPAKATKARKAQEEEEEEEEEEAEDEAEEEQEGAEEEEKAREGKESGPTNDELRVKVEQLIAGSEDVSSLTFKMMKTQLEEHFGVALGDRKAELIEILSEAM
ncbi:unnamed protein product [Hapterophycus canaliculatus]